MAAMALELAFSKFFKNGLKGSLESPIFILHGIFGSKMNWKSVGNTLMFETNRHVYCVDARNHGNSPRNPEMSYELMSSDVVQLLKSQSLSKSVMIVPLKQAIGTQTFYFNHDASSWSGGHSMGGKTAMTLSLTYPNLIDCLIVVDVAPVPSTSVSDITKNISIMKSLDLSSIKNRREANEFFKSKLPDPILRGFLVSGLIIDEQTGLMKWKTNLKAIEKNMTGLSDFPHFETTQKFTKPTLFIGGSESPYISPKVLPIIYQLFPNAVVRHIEGTGHWPHFDKPKQFRNLITEFLLNSCLNNQHK